MDYHYGTILYTNLTKQEQIWKKSSGGLMSVSVKDFSTSVLKVIKIFSDCTRKNGRAWIVPVCFYWMQFINDIHYLPGDMVMKNQRSTQAQVNNLPFVELSFSESSSELKDC